jgi:hypothetical protein
MKIPKDQTSGDFLWTDGSWVDYTPPTKLDGKPPGSDAARLVIYRGRPLGVYDTLSSFRYPFICQKALVDEKGTADCGQNNAPV